MALKKYYIKHRFKPYGQGDYYVAAGKMSKAAVKRQENMPSGFGNNYYFEYDTEEEYKNAIAKLKLEGKRILVSTH